MTYTHRRQDLYNLVLVAPYDRESSVAGSSDPCSAQTNFFDPDQAVRNSLASQQLSAFTWWLGISHSRATTGPRRHQPQRSPAIWCCSRTSLHSAHCALVAKMRHMSRRARGAVFFEDTPASLRSSAVILGHQVAGGGSGMLSTSWPGSASTIQLMHPESTIFRNTKPRRRPVQILDSATVQRRRL